MLYLVRTGKLSILFDDTTIGAGDGYAVDFFRLLINAVKVTKSGTIKGSMTDAEMNAPLTGCRMSASRTVEATTDAGGKYTRCFPTKPKPNAEALLYWAEPQHYTERHLDVSRNLRAGHVMEWTGNAGPEWVWPQAYPTAISDLELLPQH